jgi:hypothetical protein
MHEALLGAMLAMPEVHELFDWLRGLSFIESRAEGLIPHDLAREALAADVRWRNPDWYAELHRRARAYYTGRLAQAREPQQAQRVLLDYVFLHRDNPLVRFLSGSQRRRGGAGAAGRRPGSHRRPRLPPPGAGCRRPQAARWFDRACQLAHPARRRWLPGFGLLPAHATTPEDRAAGPALPPPGAACSPPSAPRRNRHALASGGAQDGYWTCRHQSLLFVNMVRHYLPPRLASPSAGGPDFLRPCSLRRPHAPARRRL